MLLQDRIDTTASAQDIFAFFQSMDQNYLAWHPEHLDFRWVGGSRLEQGGRFYFAEEIGGELLKKTVELTSVVPGREVVFRPVNRLMRVFLPRIAFVITDHGDRRTFEQTIVLRFVGPLGRWFNRRQFAAVRRHMREEGENLKRILEAPPARPKRARRAG